MTDKKKAQAGGDGPEDKKKKKVELEVIHRPKGNLGNDEPPPEPEVEKTPSEIAREEAEHRALVRKQRFKRKWPEVTRVKIITKPWKPPPPPRKPSPVLIALPDLKLRKWVPPFMRRRRRRPKLLRIPPEEITQTLYECATLKKVWHNFSQVSANKMILQGRTACNIKRSALSGAQTACIAAVCRGLLDDRTAADLTKSDVDQLIEAGDNYYKQCIIAMKCYKGKPQLQLNQLLPTFFLNDTKYTIKMDLQDKGVLAKHPDDKRTDPDLMSLMGKRMGKTYMAILSMKDKHFLLWGHPPAPESGSQVKTVCYMFDPHMLDESGNPSKVSGAGAFLRYAGVSSFVTDLLANYGELDAAARGHLKPITLTGVEVLQKEPLLREPDYDLNLKVIKVHCQNEYDSIFRTVHVEKKERPALISLSAMSLAFSKAVSRRKVLEFYNINKTKKEQAPKLPVPPEKPPTLSPEEIMQMRGEDFFLYTPRPDSHYFGRDDLAPLSKSETVLYSPVDIADQTFKSQYHKVNRDKWILRGTRHMASHRYQTFKTYTGVACCVSALMTLLRLRARAWNEDIVDETLDLGYNFYRESLAERGGPIRRIVLGELKDNFKIRNKEYTYKEIGIAVWGKLLSTDPKVLDVCRGLETFFKERDYGVLQVPGELEVAIFNEAGRYYIYHPWPADKNGYRVGLQAGGKACLLYFKEVSDLCKHFLDSVNDLKRKPFSITRIVVTETDKLPEPVNDLKPIAANRWIVRGRFHNDDERFPEDNRGKQAAPMSIAAIAMAHVLDPSMWKPDNIDETLVVGDNLYANTLDLMDKMGIDLNVPKTETEGEEEEEIVPSGLLSPTQVIDRFKVTENDFIETEVVDSGYSGQLTPAPGSGVLSFKDSLRKMFKEHNHGVVNARGCSVAVWKQGDSYYYFDPAGCDDKGYSSDEPWASSCLVRVNGNVEELANLVVGNLPPGSDDSFTVNPVMVSVSKMIPAIGAPETKLENKAFQWISKGTAAILMGPRGENTAIGKAAKKAGVEADDKAGRTLALPAAAAFVAASAAVPPPHMHQDHMYNFIDAGTEYYLNHVKETGNKEIGPQDLGEKLEMGVNTFSIELEDPIKLPLRLPDEPKGEGEEESEKELGEIEEEEEKEKPMKQIKDALFRTWNDPTKRTSAFLLLGDYHQIGVWMSAGGKLVAFDPAPTLEKGLLTPQRIRKGDELRLQRIKDEMGGEGDDNAEEEEEEEDEAMGEGEEKEEVPDFCPPESCPALMVCASPGEFIDKLVSQGRLDRKQCLAPYKLYPVNITNELTTTMKDKKGAGDAAEEVDEEEESAEDSAEALSDDAVGKYFAKIDKYTASVRGRVAQNENCYLQTPNRDHQDVANAVLGIVVDHIESHGYWKGSLVDAILQFGDRLYTRALPHASHPPRLRASELPAEFHLTNFDVNIEVESNVVTGDITAGDRGTVLNLARGIAKFFEANTHGIVCAKDYCVGIWKSDKHFCLWEPHSVCPTGVWTPGGAATLILMSSVKQIAETLKKSLDRLERTGSNKFTISAIKVSWELAKTCEAEKSAAVPDEGYELKVLTAYVEIAKGRSILRGTRPLDLPKFSREACMQSSCGAIVAACMAHVRKPQLWTRHTVDEVMSVACKLFVASIDSLGYEFRPGDDILVPLQVLKRFILGVNYIRYDLQHVFSGKLEQKEPTDVNLSYALEQFFKFHTHGILFSVPYAVAVWRVDACPAHYMMEPHACGPTGLRTDAEDDGAACVLTFTSSKQMALAYLQNIPVERRTKHHFQLYNISVKVHPIKKLDPEPPLVKSPPGVVLVPATSKVYVDGSKRRASERDRKHPPGEETCADTERATMKKDEEDPTVDGERNTSGWLVLRNGTQFMSAHHSICCKKFPHASRGKQALSCSIMAVAMSRVEDVCRWCESTLDQILESGDQLYQDSYLHYRPPSRILAIDQVLRKFFTPGNCVCRVVIYKPRQNGNVTENLLEQLTQFFREERAGVFVLGEGKFAVALFRTPKGFYMFDPDDRDRVGRTVAPPCRGRARACFSHYPDVERLAEKLMNNATSGIKVDEVKVKANDPAENGEKQETKTNEKEVRFDDDTSFFIYGVDVTALRRATEG